MHVAVAVDSCTDLSKSEISQSQSVVTAPGECYCFSGCSAEIGRGGSLLLCHTAFVLQKFGPLSVVGTASEMVITSAQFWGPVLLHWILIALCETVRPCAKGTNYVKDKECEPVKRNLFTRWILQPGFHGPLTGLCQFLTVCSCTA